MTLTIKSSFISNNNSLFDVSTDQTEKSQTVQTNPQNTPKLPKVLPEVGFTALGCDTEAKLAWAAYMAAAAQAGIADDGARREFAKQMMAANGAELTHNNIPIKNDKEVKDGLLNREIKFTMTADRVKALEDFRQQYVKNGGKIRFFKKTTIDLRQANTADGITMPPTASPKTIFHVFLKNDGRPVTSERILAQYAEDNYKGGNLWGDNYRKIGEMSVGQGVKPKIIKITPAGNNKIIDIELSARDRAVINENYKIVQQQVNEIEKIAAEIDRNNPVSQFILGALDGIKDNLVGTATMIAHPLETLNSIKELVEIIGSIKSEDIPKIYEAVKDKIKNISVEEAVNKVPYAAGYGLGMIATDILIGKGVGIALEGVKEIGTVKSLLIKLDELKLLTKTKVVEMFSDEAAGLAKQKFVQRLGELGVTPNNITNIAADPELWARATQVGGNLVGKGYTKFADFSMQIKKVLGDIGEAAISKLYRESLISLDLSKGKQILSSSGKVIDEIIVKEAKEKVFDLVKNNKPAELDAYFEDIKNKYGTEFLRELKETRTQYVENLHETSRRTINTQDLLGGHIREEHIGRSETWLRNRLDSDVSLRDTKYASSYKNEEIANRVLGKFAKQYEKDISQFAKTANSGERLQIVFETGEPSLGLGVKRGKSGTWDSSRAYVMIIKDNSEKGWYIHTSYPTLEKVGIKR